MSIRWGKMVQDLPGMERAAVDGFDSIQPSVGFLVDAGGDRLPAGIPVPEVCSDPLPRDAWVSQRGFNIYVWTEYLKKAVRYVAGLGCRKLAWSNGRARVLPLEGDMGGVKEQVLQFLYLLCDIAGNFGITIMVEPLGPRRTNFLNSLEEISDFLPLVGKPNISSMISLRELSEIGLGHGAFMTHAHLISHVQMENPLSSESERLSPRRDDGYDYLTFVRSLREIDYNGQITLPGDADADSLAYCRELWNAAGGAT